MLKKVIIFLMLISNFNNSCFDINNQDQVKTLAIKVLISFANRPRIVRDYNIAPNQTQRVPLPATSNNLQIKIFNPTNIANSQKILLLNIFNELLQDFKTSSTARIIIKNPNNQIVARILR